MISAQVIPLYAWDPVEDAFEYTLPNYYVNQTTLPASLSTDDGSAFFRDRGLKYLRVETTHCD